MRCPVCKGTEFAGTDLVSGQFKEDILECLSCGTTVAKVHGAYVMVTDAGENSFVGHDCGCEGSCDGDCECLNNL